MKVYFILHRKSVIEWKVRKVLEGGAEDKDGRNIVYFVLLKVVKVNYTCMIASSSCPY